MFAAGFIPAKLHHAEAPLSFSFSDPSRSISWPRGPLSLAGVATDQQNACTHHQDPHDASPVISTRCARDQKKKRSGKRSMWPHRTIAVRLPVGISDHTIKVPPSFIYTKTYFFARTQRRLITKIIIRVYRKLRDESIKSN
jgi:hypothetical protein